MRISDFGVGFVHRPRSLLAVRMDMPLPVRVETARVFLLQVRVKVPLRVRVEIPLAVRGEILIEIFWPVRVETSFPSTNRTNPRTNPCPNQFSVTRRRHLRGTLVHILQHTLAQGLGLGLLLALLNPVCYVSSAS
jgi:hypothetical protein